LGAYSWILNGADALVFTDDVGMKSWQLRELVCQDADRLGVLLDGQANRNAPADSISWINRPESLTKILLIPTDEELVILKQVLANN
jgi:acetate kinase